MSQERIYTCQYDWPAPPFHIQAGDMGLVVSSKEPYGYRTAFFEAFPRDPDTFIRGEGATVADAEKQAWEKWQRILACPGHEFEKHGYRNGCGICKHCGMFASDVFPPSEHCVICGKPCYWTEDIDGNWYCEEHQREKPLNKWTEIDWDSAYVNFEMAMYDRGLL